MYLREAPTLTLDEVREGLASRDGKQKQLPNRDIRLDLTGDSAVISVGGEDVPVTTQGLKAIGDWVEVPSKFLMRLDADLQQHLLSNLLDRQGAGVANVFYSDEGVEMVKDPKVKFIEPRRIVDMAIKVIDPQALAVDHWSTQDEFRLDVIVPDDFDRGVGGDLKKGDITKGGIRIAQDVKHNLAPSVSEFMYRLVCTNGMEIFDAGLKVDARGQTVDEVLAELEIAADHAFRRVEASIASFYDLREEKVDNPERSLLRMAEEQNISDRILVSMADVVPAIEGDVTMFDIVNLITNQANAPGMKSGPRRKLEQAGGTIVGDHADRCSQCQGRLDH